jgi:hypothetical protein
MNKLNIYRVTPLVDEALKLSMNAYDHKNDFKQLEGDIHSRFSCMSREEMVSFYRIGIDLDASMNPRNPNDIRYNTEYEDLSAVFEINEDSGVQKLIVWSSDENSLVNFLKKVKNNFDKKSETKVEETEQKTWAWSEDGMDYRFIFPSEYEAYKDLVRYLASVKQLIDYSKR